MTKRTSIRLKDYATVFAGIFVSGALFAAASTSSSGMGLRADRTPTPTSTIKSEPTRTPTSNPEPTRTPTPNPEPTRTPTPKPEPTRTPTPKPEPTRTPTPNPEPTRTPTPKPEPTRTPTPKPEPTRTPTPNPEPTRTPTPRPEPTRTPNPEPTRTPTPVPTPAAGSIAFTEPAYSVNEGAGTATISVRRVVINGQGTTGAVLVKYQTTTGGTATAGMDYQVVTGTLSWAAGDGSVKTFTVPIIDDSARESTETVFLRLYDLAGTGTIAPSRQKATLSIIDNETGDIDKTAPTVAITSPRDAAHVANVNVIKGTVSDEGGSHVSSVVLVIKRLSDGKFWSGTEWVSREVALSTQLTEGTWVRSLGNPPRSTLSDDMVQITARATDGAGNVGRATVQVSVDSTPPEVSISYPARDATLRKLERVLGTVSDANGDATVYLYLRRDSDGKYWMGSAWGSMTRLPVQLQSSGEWSHTEWPLLDAGEYKVSAIATDAVGNTAVDSVEFSIASTTPTSAGAS